MINTEPISVFDPLSHLISGIVKCCSATDKVCPHAPLGLAPSGSNLRGLRTQGKEHHITYLAKDLFMGGTQHLVAREPHQVNRRASPLIIIFLPFCINFSTFNVFDIGICL